MVALAVTTSDSPPAVQLATPPADPLVGLEVDQRQLDERIYDALKEKILQSELAPGTALTIRSVAQRLGVSVTPVRDALRRLQAEGLVQMQGRGETTVAQLEPGEIDDILDLRLALELHATRRGVTGMNGAALKRLEELLATAVRTFRSGCVPRLPGCQSPGPGVPLGLGAGRRQRAPHGDIRDAGRPRADCAGVLHNNPATPAGHV